MSPACRDQNPNCRWLSAHGVRLPLDVTHDHSTLTLERILEESNAEVARVMVSLHGEGGYESRQRSEMFRRDLNLTTLSKHGF
jgi:hypothetical protein